MYKVYVNSELDGEFEFELQAIEYGYDIRDQTNAKTIEVTDYEGKVLLSINRELMQVA